MGGAALGKFPLHARGRLLRFLVVVSAVLFTCAIVAPVWADVPFPARLQVTEVEAGIYDVVFTLPIVEGRSLRATPVLPETCEDLSNRETGPRAGSVTTAWRVRCSPPSLAGEVILIDGLLGTQTDLAVEISTLDRRVHTVILKPSRPGFVVPPPPNLMGLAFDGCFAGAHRVLRSSTLWLLLVVVVCLPTRWRALSVAIGAFAGGHVIGQWLGNQGWLLISEHVPPLYGLLTVAVASIYLARGRVGRVGWVNPFWLTSLFLGLLAGGARPDTLPPDGLSNTEQILAAFFFSIGVALGLSVIGAAAAEFRIGILAQSGVNDRNLRVLGFVAGVVAVAMLIYRASSQLLSPDLIPRSALPLVVLAAVIGGILSRTGFSHRKVLFSFAVLVGLGLVLGLCGVGLPLGTLLVFGSLFVLGGSIVFGQPLTLRWSILILSLSVSVFSWFVGLSLIDSVSQPVGASIGVGLLAITVLQVSLGASAASISREFTWGIRVVGVIALVSACIWRVGEYFEWFEDTIATEAALGLIRLPILALVLVILAIVFWPGKRRWTSENGLEKSNTTVHLALFGAAFMLLPMGTVAVQNPFFEPHAPELHQARRILTRVLSNTYHAFNLDDEDELFDRLDANISPGLVTDVYLDSRRRLRAGTREGAVVTVKNVSVIEIGGPLQGVEPGRGFSYDCVWTVTARVQHMQHIHFRHNTYSGVLTIDIEDENWKIAEIELTSEVKTAVSRSGV